MGSKNIIIFDGVCNLCNSAVNFIIKRDPQQHFCFAPMQGEAAQDLMAKYALEDEFGDSLFLIKQGSCYKRSDAVLEICKDLSGAWKLLLIFKLLPTSFSDLFYNWLGRRRYSLFGKRDACMLPTAELTDRFLG
ncbi:thiol-disulfide oxidoreductase DCC family protein [Shewanella sp. UCD-KL12]|uniref:thiol-disulfide oxidoreductase DCC family protein n=1 Tax=Shewanella sp. UCD-KL12 TaxID=1917163 RepID=UPI00097127B4|nr:DCC1-like thiol-disulfide oxidoreductase family protein [Shewanella sp. UCD-KL12]